MLLQHTQLCHVPLSLRFYCWVYHKWSLARFLWTCLRVIWNLTFSLQRLLKTRPSKCAEVSKICTFTFKRTDWWPWNRPLWYHGNQWLKKNPEALIGSQSIVEDLPFSPLILRMNSYTPTYKILCHSSNKCQMFLLTLKGLFVSIQWTYKRHTIFLR